MRKYFFVLSLFLCSFGSNAQIKIDFSPANLNFSEQQKFTLFVDKTVGLLPKAMQKYLKAQTIIISFSKSENEFRLPDCSEKIPSPTEGKPKADFTYGSMSNSTNGIRLMLNLGLIPGAINSLKISQTYNCGHKKFFKLVQSVIVHELAHAYDFSFSQRQSLTAQYLNLIKAKNSFAGKIIKNRQFQQSPDPYEYYSPEESFAVNFEYYILDPDYSCRKPSFADFFDEIFPDFRRTSHCKATEKVKYFLSIRRMSQCLNCLQQ